MKKRTILSVVIILLAVASVGGATAAWFTDLATVTNTFSAGTLDIDATDGWDGLAIGDEWTNVNPGDCRDKNFTITNKGSKNALIRLKYEAVWLAADGTTVLSGLDDDGDALVTIDIASGWTYHDGWWYYTPDPLAPLPPLGETGNVLTFKLEVCVDGPGTTDAYQGATSTITFTVEAVQASNNASFDQWGVNSIYTDIEVKTAENWNGFAF